MSDADHQALVQAERRRQRRLALVLGALVLVPLGFLVVSDLRLALEKREARLTPGQRTELGRLLDARAALAQGRVEAWNAAIRQEGLAALTSTDAPCPVSLAPPRPVSAATYVKLGHRDSEFGDWSLCLLRPTERPEVCAQTYAPPDDEVKLRARLDEGDVYTWDLEAAKSAPPPAAPPRVLLLVEAETPYTLREPTVGQLSFVPGTLSGRALLFVPAEGRFVCGATVSAQNSRSVESEFDTLGGKPSQAQTEEAARAALRRDLEVRVRMALPAAWRLLAAPAH